MIPVIRVVLFAALFALGLGRTASAQGTLVPAGRSDGWKVTVYPILAWVPIGIKIDVDAPAGGDDGGSIATEIVDSRFDGAFFGGVSASKGGWRIDGDVIWAAFGGDRPERPLLRVDLDVVYGEGSLGRRVAPNLFVTAGVRRIAVGYDIVIGDVNTLSDKRGLWDPLVGVSWHRERSTLEWHASFQGGGFGVGSDVDLNGSLRVDWKPSRHFGITGGYKILYLKLSDDDVRGQPIEIKSTLHGPTVGFGLYF